MSSGWRGAVCVGVRDETPTARSIRLRVTDLDDVVAGQHVDVRLTADDGYQAVRSYSLSAVPGSVVPGSVVPGAVVPGSVVAEGIELAADEVEITVEELDEGEVSPYLVRGLEVGDEVEVRGPVGGWFVWHPADTQPVQLIGGGSGIAPLMAMVRSRRAVASEAPFRILVSVRAPTALYYRDELAALAASGAVAVDTVFTREAPASSPRTPGRLTPELLAELVAPPADGSAVYVCGPNGFVEAVTGALVALGHPADLIRTERFGGV